MRPTALFALVLLALVLHGAASAQKQFLGGYRLDAAAAGTTTLPPSNSVSHVIYGDGYYLHHYRCRW